MRGYKEQFEPEIANQIEALAYKLENIVYPTGPSRFYGLDLAMCLKSGALAGSMIIASALLEIYVRGLVIEYTERAQSGWTKQVDAEKELEAMKGMNFYKLLNNLVSIGLFSTEDADKSERLYKSVRIPTHHGLPSRLLGRDKDDPFSSIMGLLGRSSKISMSEFEDFIEYEAISIVGSIVEIIERNQITHKQNA